MTWHLTYLALFICSKIDKSTVLGFTIGARETKRNKERSVALTENPSTGNDTWVKHVQQGQLN